MVRVKKDRNNFLCSHMHEFLVLSVEGNSHLYSIDWLLSEHKIKRSLSYKGNAYENVVAEATFKILKTELINETHYQSLGQLSLEFFDYVNSYNDIRTHGTLGHPSPVAYKNLSLKINV